MPRKKITQEKQPLKDADVLAQLPLEIIINHLLSVMSGKDIDAFKKTSSFFHDLITTELSCPEQLLRLLSSLPTVQMAQFIHAVFRPTSNQIYQQLKAQAEDTNTSAEAIVCFALVTDNVTQFWRPEWKLEMAKRWLKKSKYHQFIGTLEAILNIINHNRSGHLLAILSRPNTFFNLASLDFDDVLELSQRRLTCLSLDGANFEKVRLIDFSLVACKMRGVHLNNAELCRGLIDGCDMENACATGASFFSMTIHRVNLVNASLQNACFRSSSFDLACMMEHINLDHAFIPINIVVGFSKNNVNIHGNNIKMFVSDDLLNLDNKLNHLIYDQSACNKLPAKIQSVIVDDLIRCINAYDTPFKIRLEKLEQLLIARQHCFFAQALDVAVCLQFASVFGYEYRTTAQVKLDQECERLLLVSQQHIPARQRLFKASDFDGLYDAINEKLNNIHRKNYNYKMRIALQSYVVSDLILALKEFKQLTKAEKLEKLQRAKQHPFFSERSYIPSLFGYTYKTAAQNRLDQECELLQPRRQSMR